MNRGDEDQLVYKMMQDANRRKIKHEKLQRAKLEAELQEVCLRLSFNPIILGRRIAQSKI